MFIHLLFSLFLSCKCCYANEVPWSFHAKEFTFVLTRFLLAIYAIHIVVLNARFRRIKQTNSTCQAYAYTHPYTQARAHTHIYIYSTGFYIVSVNQKNPQVIGQSGAIIEEACPRFWTRNHIDERREWTRTYMVEIQYL